MILTRHPSFLVADHLLGAAMLSISSGAAEPDRSGPGLRKREEPTLYDDFGCKRVRFSPGLLDEMNPFLRHCLCADHRLDRPRTRGPAKAL